MTIFEGEPGHQKTQLFRAEWAGFTLWQAGGLSLQAPGAGHPHWQFDALRAFEERKRLEGQANEIAKSFATAEVQVEEFNNQTLLELSPQTVTHRWTGMHFASQAQWAEFGWDGDNGRVEMHARAPNDESEVRRWLTAAVLYIRSELMR